MNSPRVFEMLEPMIEPLNELLAAKAVLMNFNGNEATMADNAAVDVTVEFSIHNYYGTALAAYNTFAPHPGAAARLDFERARALTDRFQRPELQTMARLNIAQQILQDNAVNGRFYNRGMNYPRHISFAK
jgi:hypothetical protein